MYRCFTKIHPQDTSHDKYVKVETLIVANYDNETQIFTNNLDSFKGIRNYSSQAIIEIHNPLCSSIYLGELVRICYG